MAQATKPRASTARSKATKTTKRKTPVNRKASGSRARSTSRRRNGSSGNGAGSARKAIESTAKQAGSAMSDTGRSVGQMARKAKTPLLAGGAAVAGAAGGLALGARQARKSKTLRRPKVKIDSHDLAKAAKSVGRFGVEMGELASELRKNREETNGAKHRSPVEVVLDGLTHRARG
jgi:hypothetical protein